MVSSANYPFYPVNTNQFPGLVVALLTARLQIELIDAPVVQVLLEGHRAALLSQVKFPRPVEVDDGPEVPGMSVKVVLVVLRVELVAQLQDLLSAPSPPQFPQTCLRQPVYEGPGDVEPGSNVNYNYSIITTSTTFIISGKIGLTLLKVARACYLISNGGDSLCLCL